MRAEPIVDEILGVGTVVHVPLWVEREDGREGTTIYVSEANVIEVLPPG